jgi:hypothetical protein
MRGVTKQPAALLLQEVASRLEAIAVRRAIRANRPWGSGKAESRLLKILLRLLVVEKQLVLLPLRL